MFNYMSKTVPQSARVNESNFEKIAYGSSHKKADLYYRNLTNQRTCDSKSKVVE